MCRGLPETGLTITGGLCYKTVSGIESMSTSPEREPRPREGSGLDPLVVKMCIAALWSDGAMAAAERDHLSHLIDEVVGDEDQREELRRLALHGIDRHAALAELGRIEPAARLDLFDHCRAVVTSDRHVRPGEVRFLAELGRACGLGFGARQRILWALSPRRRLTVFAVAALAVALAVLPRVLREEAGLPPPEIAMFRKIHLSAARPEASLDAASLFERVRRSVVTVNVTIDGARHGSGSGVVIAADELGQLYILTNRHVVFHELAPGRELVFDAGLESGVRLPALLDFYSRRWDLALLVVPGLTGWAGPLPVARRAAVRVGQRVYAVGSPLGLDHTFTAGVISAVRGQFLQTDATVHSGSSGGPLLDERGAVCGVVTATHPSKDLSFALSADAITDMVGERRESKGRGQVGAPRGSAGGSAP